MPNVIDLDSYREAVDLLKEAAMEYRIKKAFIEYIKKLSNFEIEPTHARIGFCDNLNLYLRDKYALPSVIWHYSNKDCFKYWYSWSGSASYPIPAYPGCDKDPKIAYNTQKKEFWDITTSYGQMRYNYIHWLHNNIQADNIRIDVFKDLAFWTITLIWTNTEVEPFHET